jgi:dTDP-4-dehydrorhamnose 3,5-epimerase-like enzyme
MSARLARARSRSPRWTGCCLRRRIPVAASSPERVLVTKLKVHADARGAVFEPLEPALLDGWQNVHAVITEPGAVRGNHRHLRGTEISSVSGAALVRYREGSQTRDAQVPLGEVWRFEFPAGVAHAFKNTGDTPFLIVSFNTERHDPAVPKAERVELILG